MEVLSDDALFVDKLLNSGYSSDRVHDLAKMTSRNLPPGYAERRISHIEKQKAIKDALPPGIEQRTPEWYSAREGFVTASDFHAASFGTDSMRKRFVTNKTGQGPPFLGSMATRHGVKYEDVARLLYEHYMHTKVTEYGLLPHKTVKIMAASPDGISEQGVAVEIKAPFSKTLADIPPEYYAQMQGQMEVAELDLADFVVCRVEELSDVIFWKDFNTAYDKGYGYERYGAVATCEGKFMHSTPGLTPESLNKWIGTVPLSHEVTLHRVFDFRITRIERDDIYVSSMIEKLRETWDMVLDARANPSKVSVKTSNVSPILKGFSFKNFGT